MTNEQWNQTDQSAYERYVAEIEEPDDPCGDMAHEIDPGISSDVMETTLRACEHLARECAGVHREVKRLKRREDWLLALCAVLMLALMLVVAAGGLR